MRHDKLFEILIERKVDSIESFIRYISETDHENSWNGIFFSQFSTSNGIRQGGVISTVLFCVYMNALLKRLEAEGFVCWIGNHYFGSVGYADDLKLLSPTAHGLRRMTKICEEFRMIEYGL